MTWLLTIAAWILNLVRRKPKHYADLRGTPAETIAQLRKRDKEWWDTIGRGSGPK